MIDLEEIIFFMVKVIMVVLVTVTFLMMIYGMGYGIWWMFQPPTTKITLVKDDWKCTASVKESYTTYVKSGNIMVPVTGEHVECVRYEKN